MSAISMEVGLFLFSFIAFIIGGLTLTNLDEDYEDISTVVVEHSFDSGPEPVFTRRGTISIQSLKSGVAHFSQERELTLDEQAKLKDLVRTDGIYRVRVLSKTVGQQDVPTQYVHGFIKACALYESRLSDKLTLHVDLYGSVLGLAVSTTMPYCLGLDLDDELTRFNTTTDVMQTVTGPIPETQSYVEKIEREKAEKAKGQQQDTRSFLAKYWMYIVPVVLIMMFANSAGDQNQGGGGR